MALKESVYIRRVYVSETQRRKRGAQERKGQIEFHWVECNFTFWLPASFSGQRFEKAPGYLCSSKNSVAEDSLASCLYHSGLFYLWGAPHTT